MLWESRLNYIEIYQIDVLNLPTGIIYRHDVLLGLVPPAATPPPVRYQSHRPVRNWISNVFWRAALQITHR